MKDIYKSKDKQIVPFLLIQPDIKYLGIEARNSIFYFCFSPRDKCEQLVNSFLTHNAPLVDPKTLLDAVETFRDRVFEMKEKRKNYESGQT